MGRVPVRHFRRTHLFCSGSCKTEEKGKKRNDGLFDCFTCIYDCLGEKKKKACEEDEVEEKTTH